MTQAQQALAAVQAYGAPALTEDDHTYTRGLWEAVIQRAEGYDEEATAQADPSHTNARCLPTAATGGTQRSRHGKPDLHPIRNTWTKSGPSAPYLRRDTRTATIP